MNELEKEIKRLVFIEKPINSSTLSLAVEALNNRIRFNGLSSREILYQRDQFTGKQYFKMTLYHHKGNILGKKDTIPVLLINQRGVHQHQSIHVMLVI